MRKCVLMLHVYLDQNHWVYLTKGRLGRDRGLSDIYAALQKAVAAGVVSFPLSSTHYMETWARRNARSRWELATTMLELARRPGRVRPDTIAAPHEVVPMEIDLALRRRFGVPTSPRTYPIYGEGVAHAYGQTDLAYHLPDQFQSHQDADKMQLVGTWFLETGALTGPSNDYPVPGIDSETYKLFSQRFLQGD